MNILCLGPHPDDLEFGVGGTLAKYSKAGHDVSLMIMTKGGLGGSEEVREAEQVESGRIMGVKEIFWGGYGDTELKVDSNTIKSIEQVIKQVKPEIIFAPFSEDTHQDHRALAKLAMSAGRYARNLLFFETPTTYASFQPTIFVDIDDVLKLKIKALMAHHSQIMKTHIEDTSIIEMAQSSAVFRGIQSRVRHAEGFVSIRYFLDF